MLLSFAGTPTGLLAYPRFSVALDPARRLAAVTGVNIDGASLRDVARTELAGVDVGPLEAADVFETTSVRSGWRALRTTADIGL